MSDPFIGEIRPFGFNYAPVGWALCAGQLLPIAQNTALFSILGTQYGGDGKTTFALPDLRGRVPLHAGAGPGLTPRVPGEMGGTETVTLTPQQLAAHSHGAAANSGVGNAYAPTNAFWSADAGGANEYAATPNVSMAADALALTGGTNPHGNLQPYLVINYCIALQGIFPQRN